MSARLMTPDEHVAGHAVCECKEFTQILSQRAMQRLPKDYSGELCKRCSMWMCRVDKLQTMTSQPEMIPRTCIAGSIESAGDAARFSSRK